MDIIKLPNRKRNRLESFDYGQNGAYFVTICVQNRAPLLSRVTVCGCDCVLQLTALGGIVKEFIGQISQRYPSVSVDKYVIMPDHIHLLLRFDTNHDDIASFSDKLGRIMGWFKYQTTKQCNIIRCMQSEKLWQRSYYDHVIRNFTDYQETWQYIENNPRKWVLDRDLIRNN